MQDRSEPSQRSLGRETRESFFGSNDSRNDETDEANSKSYKHNNVYEKNINENMKKNIRKKLTFRFLSGDNYNNK